MLSYLSRSFAILTMIYSYNPIFMNDAMDGQPVLESYGPENFQRLKKAKEAYDPTGFFTTRQGGFKVQL